MSNKIFGFVLVSALSFVNISGCTKREPGRFSRVYTLSKIIKNSNVWLRDQMEATPFHWLDGRLLYMVDDRDHGKILIYEGSRIISEFTSPLGLGCAVVFNNKLFIFGTTNWTSPQNSVYYTESRDLKEWSAPTPVIQAGPDVSVFNTSVTQLPDKTFLMAVEFCKSGDSCFNIEFKNSADLEHWKSVGTPLNRGEYTACPTIRFVNGYYYLFYLRNVGHYATFVSRSEDLITWQHSEKAVLSSLDSDSEGNNNSDLDLIEDRGQVVLNYAIGDQVSYKDIKVAYYNGSMVNFVNEFF